VTADLEQALAQWPDWPLPLTAPPRVEAELKSGRTNQNYRLSAPGLGDDLLLRLHRPDAERLGIDRERELLITQTTAEAGIGRPVWHWTGSFSIFPFIPARPWRASDFSRPAQRDRLWPLIDALAELDIGTPRRRYSDYLQRYWQQLVAESRIDPPLAREWSAFWPDLLAFDEADWTAGLVHHDLIPANLLDTGNRLVLIDWEYAAMGHPGIDRWTVDPDSIGDSIDASFIAALMAWINRLWARLA
jgi:thiamine kinase-like enzyme